MRLINSFVCCFTLAFFSFNACAQYSQHRDYVGGRFIRGNLGIVGEDIDVNVLDLRLGVELQDWLHLEGRVGFGLNDKSVGGIKFSIHRLVGIHAVVSLPDTTLLRPYALAGFSYGEVDIRIPGFGTAEESETGLSFGLGTDVGHWEGIDVFVEYMHYFDKNEIEFDGIGIGVKFDF